MKKLLLGLTLLASMSSFAEESRISQIEVTLDEQSNVRVDCGDSLTIGSYEGNPKNGLDNLRVACRPVECRIYDQRMENKLLSLNHSEQKFIEINGKVQSCHSNLEGALTEANKLLGEKCRVVKRMRIVRRNNCK